MILCVCVTLYELLPFQCIFFFFFCAEHGPMQVWTRAVLLDQISTLPVKLRCRFAIRYLQYAMGCQVLVYRHPILQEKTTPRYSQLVNTHRTHSPVLKKVSKMSKINFKNLVIPSTFNRSVFSPCSWNNPLFKNNTSIIISILRYCVQFCCLYLYSPEMNVHYGKQL